MNRKNPELSFHKIPKNPELKKKWVRVFKRKCLMELNLSHRVCSAHFAGGIIIVYRPGARRIRRNIS